MRNDDKNTSEAWNGFHCDPECKHLQPGEDTSDVLGTCDKFGDLDWYDFYIAKCRFGKNN